VGELSQPAWTGWHRPHKRAAWQQVCLVDSEGACWELLLSAINPGGELIVQAACRHPDDRAKGSGYSYAPRRSVREGTGGDRGDRATR
jgi:hypothetical protein